MAFQDYTRIADDCKRYFIRNRYGAFKLGDNSSLLGFIASLLRGSVPFTVVGTVGDSRSGGYRNAMCWLRMDSVTVPTPSHLPMTNECNKPLERLDYQGIDCAAYQSVGGAYHLAIAQSTMEACRSDDYQRNKFEEVFRQVLLSMERYMADLFIDAIYGDIMHIGGAGKGIMDYAAFSLLGSVENLTGGLILSKTIRAMTDKWLSKLQRGSWMNPSRLIYFLPQSYYAKYIEDLQSTYVANSIAFMNWRGQVDANSLFQDWLTNATVVGLPDYYFRKDASGNLIAFAIHKDSFMFDVGVHQELFNAYHVRDYTASNGSIIRHVSPSGYAAMDGGMKGIGGMLIRVSEADTSCKFGWNLWAMGSWISAKTDPQGFYFFKLSPDPTAITSGATVPADVPVTTYSASATASDTPLGRAVHDHAPGTPLGRQDHVPDDTFKNVT